MQLAAPVAIALKQPVAPHIRLLQPPKIVDLLRFTQLLIPLTIVEQLAHAMFNVPPRTEELQQTALLAQPATIDA
jgi:hypothetical protein